MWCYGFGTTRRLSIGHDAGILRGRARFGDGKLIIGYATGNITEPTSTGVLNELTRINDVAVCLGVSRPAVYRMRESGRPPLRTVSVGAERRVSRRSLTLEVVGHGARVLLPDADSCNPLDWAVPTGGFNRADRRD